MNTEAALVATLDLPLTLHQRKINGHTINYAVLGSGEPLLLIHGANFGWGVWYPNLPLLAKHYTVYALDLPGAGRSSVIDYATLDAKKDLFDVVEQFVTKLNLQNLRIIGCSVGGWLAMTLALAQPARVKKIVVENSVGFSDYFGFGDLVISQYPLAQLITRTLLKPHRQNKRIEQFLRSIFFHKSLPILPAFLEYFYETMSGSHNLLFISRLTALREHFVLGSRLSKIHQPTMIVWGKEDTIMPLLKNQPNFSLIPHAQTVLIDEAGHIPSFEQPDRFHEAVLPFLREV